MFLVGQNSTMETVNMVVYNNMGLFELAYVIQKPPCYLYLNRLITLIMIIDL